MKLLRYGSPGEERPGCIDANGDIRDLSSIINDVADEALSAESLSWLRDLPLEKLPRIASEVRLGPCVGGTRSFVCVGLNYADHAAETGAIPPPEPVLFLKSTSAICGPNDDVWIPRGSAKTDWEVELGVVIGATARYVKRENALAHVAGYCVVNDVSERAFQLEGTGQWVKGKSCDRFAPIGPWLVTSDAIIDPQSLDMWLDVNDTPRQRGNSRTMIFSVAELVAYISRFMTLRSGDIISTGTPPGVGLGMKPPQFLQSGDTVRLGIEGLGEQYQQVTLAPSV